MRRRAVSDRLLPDYDRVLPGCHAREHPGGTDDLARARALDTPEVGANPDPLQ